jgi:hypothetical protein
MAVIACTAGGFSQVMIFRLPDIEDDEPEPLELEFEGLELELQAAPNTVIVTAREPASTGRFQ